MPMMSSPYTRGTLSQVFSPHPRHPGAIGFAEIPIGERLLDDDALSHRLHASGIVAGVIRRAEEAVAGARSGSRW